MSAGNHKFVTIITCMDGRVQAPGSNWMKQAFKADFVDTITEPGPEAKIESVKDRVLISVNAHHSDTVAIAAHHDCAGNPVSAEKHAEMVKECVKIVESWKLPVKVLGLWINEKWEVERL